MEQILHAHIRRDSQSLLTEQAGLGADSRLLYVYLQDASTDGQ